MGNLCTKPLVKKQVVEPNGYWPKPDTTVLAQERAILEEQAARKLQEESALMDENAHLDPSQISLDEDGFETHRADNATEEDETTIRPIKWLKGKPLGQGAFGTVYLGFNLENGGFMAVKQVLVASDPTLTRKVNEHVRALQSEVAVLKQLQHPNIVRYLGTQRSDEHLNIFLEYVPGGSIASLLAKFGAFHESVIRVYTRQILEGLHYLHQNQIMHRDVKGANILVDHNGKIKLADFGASKRIESLVTMGDGYKTFTGTPYYMAPEVIKQTGYGRSADVWSVGCTVVEMATGRAPWTQFHNHQPLSALFAIASANQGPPVPDTLSPEARDFLALIFTIDHRLRPNTTRLLKHPFVRNAFPISSPGAAAAGYLTARTPESAGGAIGNLSPLMNGQYSPLAPYGQTPSPVKEDPTLEGRHTSGLATERERREAAAQAAQASQQAHGHAGGFHLPGPAPTGSPALTARTGGGGAGVASGAVGASVVSSGLGHHPPPPSRRSPVPQGGPAAARPASSQAAASGIDASSQALLPTKRQLFTASITTSDTSGGAFPQNGAQIPGTPNPLPGNAATPSFAHQGPNSQFTGGAAPPAPQGVAASTASGLSGMSSGMVFRFGVPGREVEVTTPPEPSQYSGAGGAASQYPAASQLYSQASGRSRLAPQSSFGPQSSRQQPPDLLASHEVNFTPGAFTPGTGIPAAPPTPSLGHGDASQGRANSRAPPRRPTPPPYGAPSALLQSDAHFDPHGFGNTANGAGAGPGRLARGVSGMEYEDGTPATGTGTGQGHGHGHNFGRSPARSNTAATTAAGLSPATGTTPGDAPPSSTTPWEGQSGYSASYGLGTTPTPRQGEGAQYSDYAAGGGASPLLPPPPELIASDPDPAVLQQRFARRIDAASEAEARSHEAAASSGRTGLSTGQAFSGISAAAPLSSRYRSSALTGPSSQQISSYGTFGAEDQDCDSVVFRSPTDVSVNNSVTPATGGMPGTAGGAAQPCPTPLSGLSDRLAAAAGFETGAERTEGEEEEEEDGAESEYGGDDESYGRPYGASPGETPGSQALEGGTPLSEPGVNVSAEELKILMYVQRKSIRDFESFRRSLGPLAASSRAGSGNSRGQGGGSPLDSIGAAGDASGSGGGTLSLTLGAGVAGAATMLAPGQMWAPGPASAAPLGIGMGAPPMGVQGQPPLGLPLGALSLGPSLAASLNGIPEEEGEGRGGQTPSTLSAHPMPTFGELPLPVPAPGGMWVEGEGDDDGENFEWQEPIKAGPSSLVDHHQHHASAHPAPLSSRALEPAEGASRANAAAGAAGAAIGSPPPAVPALAGLEAVAAAAAKAAGNYTPTEYPMNSQSIPHYGTARGAFLKTLQDLVQQTAVQGGPGPGNPVPREKEAIWEQELARELEQLHRLSLYQQPPVQAPGGGLTPGGHGQLQGGAGTPLSARAMKSPVR